MAESSASYKVVAESPSISGFIALNTWTHDVVQRTNINTVKMLINGNQLPVTYTTNSPNTGDLDHGDTDPFYVGASFRNNTLTKLSSGNLRHVRIYTRALPAKEIRQNYNNYCGTPANSNALVFWEPFTEGVFTASGGSDYVYDRIYNAAGLKSGTIAFETPGSNTLVPAHRLTTTYQYNSLNQVLQQYSPDGDTSKFYYDRLGRLFASQNKEQKHNTSYSGAANRFSYTLYDSLGRIKEVGEKSGADSVHTIDHLDTADVNTWLAGGTDRQITRTIYDNPVNINLQDYNTSRKRVVSSIYLETESSSEGDSTLYNYDILGNVKMLLQHVKELVAVDATNGRKQVDYEYDLVSGKVNRVSYQHGKGDQFYYKYSYDADNRVTRSYSSRDKLVWMEDASYGYYLHGPLARTELGHYKVQGVDYSYTLQGWLKGINSDSLSHLFDMANDGRQNTTYSRMSRDVYGFKIGYYNSDYTPIVESSADAFSKKAYTAPGSLESTGNQLFNGNISFTTLALSKINSVATTGYSYGYDQLNRLTEMRQHTTGTTSGWSNSDIITAYRESISYDANGNILKYLRKGTAATPHMDSLTYKYTYSSGNLVSNKLQYVKDSIPSGNYSVDIDDQGSSNYTYDYIGNLKKDAVEGIDTIRWTVYGKINRIVKASVNTVINYGYDPAGNRTFKNVTVSSKAGDDVTRTWYIRDAQGNTLAVYGKKNSEAIKWDEQHLYGSSRLGMWNPDTTVAANPPVVISSPIQDSLMLGSRNYELSNHLGNVLSVISDKKIGNDSSGTVNYYIAEVLSQNDYYPFGMLQPARQYSAGTGYRYGFNGKENDNEVKGEGNQQDYGMRIYDPRLGRFLSVDPLVRTYPELTSYQFASNTPVRAVDLDGGEMKDVNEFGWGPESSRRADISRRCSIRDGKEWLVAPLAGLFALAGGAVVFEVVSSSAIATATFRTMVKTGLATAIVNTSISIVKGDDLYTTVKSGASGFFGGAVLGAYGKLSTLKQILAVGAFSGVVEEFSSQSFDMVWGERKEYSVEDLLTSGVLSSFSNYLSHKIVDYLNSVITKKYATEIKNLESNANKDKLRKVIRGESPQLGPEALKKELRRRISNFKRALLKQEEIDKAVIKQTIEKSLDEAKQKLRSIINNVQ
jgi:RHS repeat-associated protein